MGVGGGVRLSGGSISFSRVRGNRASVGGGISAGNALIEMCTIVGNDALFLGGGGLAVGNCYVLRTTISGNVGEAGGGVRGSNSQFHSVIIWGNCAIEEGDEIYANPGLTFNCCCLNPAGVYGDVTYVGPQVFADPQFCAPLGCEDAPTTGGDYELTSHSPCLPGNSPCGSLIGALGEGCEPVPVISLTNWGRLKARFR